MNKKGFTLIELIVTIALLAMISLISFVSINKTIQKSKDTNCKNIIGSIKNAAQVYFSDNRYSTSVDTVTVDTLYDGHYLQNKKVKDPYGDGDINIDGNTTITAKKLSNGEIKVYNGSSEYNCDRY